MIGMEKSPEELGKVFELINNKSIEKLHSILPLKVKFGSIFAANQADMETNIDKKILISNLLKLEEPAKFAKMRDDTQKQLEDKLNQLQNERSDLDLQCRKTLEDEYESIKNQILLLPNKLKDLIDRYNSLKIMMTTDGMITKTFKDFEKYINSTHRRLINKKKWKRSLRGIISFGTIVIKIIEALTKSYYTENEFDFNKFIHQADMQRNKLAEYSDIETVVSNMDDYEDYPEGKHISKMYEIIRNKENILEELIKTIADKTEIKRLISEQKNKLVQIRSDQKRLRLKMMKLDGPIGWTTNYINSGEYVLPVFWKHIILDLNDHSGKTLSLLNYSDYTNWTDARNKFGLITKINLILDSFHRVFSQLLKGFDEAMSNLKQAKRNYNRYKDRSARVALEKSTMHSVEIDAESNKILKYFYELCKNLNNVNIYIDDTNKFYDENVVLVTEMYSELKQCLSGWSIIFKKMFKV